VASRSIVTRPLSAPGAASPASAHARSRAAARAARIAFSARGPSAARFPDQPGDHRVRRDRPGQFRLFPQHRDIGQAVTAQRDRGGQIRDDLPRVVNCLRRPPASQTLRQAPAQAGDPHRLPQQDRSGLGHQAPAVSGHGDPGAACVILRLESSFGWVMDRTLDKPNPPRSKALLSYLFHIKESTGLILGESPRLGCAARETTGTQMLANKWIGLSTARASLRQTRSIPDS
jgi:hypothetical protein